MELEWSGGSAAREQDHSSPEMEYIFCFCYGFEENDHGGGGSASPLFACSRHAPLLSLYGVATQEKHVRRHMMFVQELKGRMPFGALVGNSSCGIQTYYFGRFSNEQAQGDVQNIYSSAFYYPQFPDFSNLVGWSSHHEPEEIQTSGYLSGCYHGYHQSTINQSSTGTGQSTINQSSTGTCQSTINQSSTRKCQPATAINNGGFQELRK